MRYFRRRKSLAKRDGKLRRPGNKAPAPPVVAPPQASRRIMKKK